MCLCLLARRFTLAYALILSYKRVFYLLFYFPFFIFFFLFNTAHPPYWILLPQLSLFALPLSYFTPLLMSAYIQALLLPLISMSWTNSSIVPLGLSNNFLFYTLFVIIDKMALFIFTTRVIIAIYPFCNLTLKDLFYLYMQAFIIFKTFSSFIQVIPSPLKSYHLQLLIDRICRNYYISNTTYFIFLGESLF